MPRFSRENRKRSIPLAAFALVFVAGILAVLLFDYTLHATSTNAFCTSCHSMQITKQEYEASIHYANASGVSATCADCHIPEAFVPKMITSPCSATRPLNTCLVNRRRIIFTRRWPRHRFTSSILMRGFSSSSENRSISCTPIIHSVLPRGSRRKRTCKRP